MIATDHAPHSTEEKSRGLEKSAMGIVGLETAFPLLYTYLVKPGLLSFPRLMELLHDAPCRRFGLPQGSWTAPTLISQSLIWRPRIPSTRRTSSLRGRPPPSPAGRYRPAAC